MRTNRLIVAAALLGLGWAGGVRAADVTSPTTAPAAAPTAADPDVQALIAKLADGRAAVRDEATKKLSAMGKAAIPALKGALDTDDPELRIRVKSLLRHAVRRLPPAAPPENAAFHTQSMRVSVTNGRKTIDVNDNGYKVHIEQKPDGIKMDVTGVEDGKEVTETYEAKDADELKKDNPEAAAIYDKWNGNGNGGGVFFRGGLGGAIRLNAGAVQGGALPDDAVKQIQELIRQQILQGNQPADQQNRILDRLNDIQQLQRDVQEKLRERMREQADHEKPQAVPGGNPPPGANPNPDHRPPGPQPGDVLPGDGPPPGSA